MAAQQVAGEGVAIFFIEKRRKLVELQDGTESPPPLPRPTILTVQGESGEIVDVAEKQFQYMTRTK